MYALLIKDGLVQDVVSVNTLDDAAAYHQEYLCIERTGEEWIGWGYADGVFTPPLTGSVQGHRPTITRLAFMRRFTPEHRIAIREAAKTDPVLNDALVLLDLAQDVDLDDPDTQRLVGYLAMLGLIAPEDVAIILG